MAEYAVAGILHSFWQRGCRSHWFISAGKHGSEDASRSGTKAVPPTFNYAGMGFLAACGVFGEAARQWARADGVAMNSRRRGHGRMEARATIRNDKQNQGPRRRARKRSISKLDRAASAMRTETALSGWWMTEFEPVSASNFQIFEPCRRARRRLPSDSGFLG